MTIRGLNHITLATADLDRSVVFYRDVLGLTLDHQWPDGAYFSAGDLWLCLSLDPEAAATQDYSHIALDVAAEDFMRLSKCIRASGAPIWKDNRSEGASLYFRDPTGHKLELHVGTLASRLAAFQAKGSIGCPA
ncbi:MAG: VOC family protein [Dinoroseobacter sp.]|nr:VOC family protein [Dinoroseobacter sp.]